VSTTIVTVIGGGTGSFNVLSGLRDYSELTIRSIVSMMDSGGDSGRLRDEFGVLPPGDVRRCLVALSGESQLLRELFSHRFADPPLAGRNFGNLFLLALTQVLGSQKEALDAISRILKIRGRVIPVTWDDCHICAELADGTTIVGEANIDVPKPGPSIPIERVFLDRDAKANDEALEAIAESDFIVLAPGDLYTSTIPNLIVQGVSEALTEARAPLIYVLNLMTKYGETMGYSASHHVERIRHYGGRVPDAVLVHDGPIPAHLLARYESDEAHRVEVDRLRLEELGVRIIRSAELMSATSLVRHDPQRVGEALVDLFGSTSWI